MSVSVLGECGGVHQEEAGLYPSSAQVSSVTAHALRLLPVFIPQMQWCLFKAQVNAYV